MESHHCSDLPITLANFLDEAFVFIDAAAHHVSVRDFITKRGADPCLADGVFDQVKRAIAHAWRSMVVNNRGRAVTNALDERDLCRKSDILLAQGSIYFPPQALEDFYKVRRGFAWDSHATRHR